jgi:hypothetical protein
MSTIYLISCVSEKHPAPMVAKDLYVSSLFKKARHYAEQTGCPWFILSAQYGLVSPEQVIDPYERTLNEMPIAERRDWARRVFAQLMEAAPQIDRAVFLAGHRYREFLMALLRERDISVEVPMEGLRIGEQLSWLGKHDG